MAEISHREHFLPLRKNDLINLICADEDLPAAERQEFRQSCLLISAIFHFECQQRLESLQDVYAHFDPDSQTPPLMPLDPADRRRQLDLFFDQFSTVMEQANFRRLTREEILAAAEGESGLWGINMDVDMDVFERLDVFTRGDGTARHVCRRWWNLWRKRELVVPVYQRLVLIFKLRKHSRLDPGTDVDNVYLKMFKDNPKKDMDMLMPGASAPSKLNFGVPKGVCHEIPKNGGFANPKI